MDFNKAYAVDNDAVNNGKWLTTQAGMRVKVAKGNNPAYVAELTRLQKDHLPLLTSDADTSELTTSIVIEAMAKTVLKDWEHDEDYTVGLGIQFLTMYPDFREDVAVLSESRSNFRPEELVEK